MDGWIGEGNLLVRRPQPLEELSASGGRDKHDTGARCEDEILGLGYEDTGCIIKDILRPMHNGYCNEKFFQEFSVII